MVCRGLPTLEWSWNNNRPLTATFAAYRSAAEPVPPAPVVQPRSTTGITRCFRAGEGIGPRPRLNRINLQRRTP